MANGAYNRNLVISNGCKTYLLADMLQSVLKRFPETTPSPSTTRKHEDELRAPNCTQCDWKGEKDGLPFQRASCPEKDGPRRRHRDHSHLRVVSPGMPRRWMRHPPVRQRRRARQGRRRPRPSAHARAPLPPLPRAEGSGVPPRPPSVPHEARPERPRAGQMGANQLG